MRTDGSLGACVCGRDAAYASTLECTRCYKRRMAKRPKTYCTQCLLRTATYVEEGLCHSCRQDRIAGYPEQLCKEEDCTEPLYVKAPLKGYCRSHWEKSLRDTVRPSEWLSEPQEWRSSKFDSTAFEQILKEAKKAFLMDSHYMWQVAKDAGYIANN